MARLEASLVDIVDLKEPYEKYDSYVKTSVDILHDKINQRILHHEQLRGHQVESFSIETGYGFKSRKYFDPSDFRTWDKRDIITKWMLARQAKRAAVMELFCVITEDMVPTSYKKTPNELFNDLKHGLEEAYCGHEIPLPAQTNGTSPADFEAIVLIVLFRFAKPPKDLDLFHNVQTLRDMILKSYTDQVVERILQTAEQFLADKDSESNDVSVMFGSSYADEGNRLVFDRMKLGTWVERGLEETGELLCIGHGGSTTLLSIFAITDDIVPKFLDGYELKYPYEFVSQDVAERIVEALERYVIESNDRKLCGFDLVVGRSDKLKMPWPLHHRAAVVWLAYHDPAHHVTYNPEEQSDAILSQDENDTTDADAELDVTQNVDAVEELPVSESGCIVNDDDIQFSPVEVVEHEDEISAQDAGEIADGEADFDTLQGAVESTEYGFSQQETVESPVDDAAPQEYKEPIGYNDDVEDSSIFQGTVEISEQNTEEENSHDFEIFTSNEAVDTLETNI